MVLVREGNCTLEELEQLRATRSQDGDGIYASDISSPSRRRPRNRSPQFEFVPRSVIRVRACLVARAPASSTSHRLVAVPLVVVLLFVVAPSLVVLLSSACRPASRWRVIARPGLVMPRSDGALNNGGVFEARLFQRCPPQSQCAGSLAQPLVICSASSHPSGCSVFTSESSGTCCSPQTQL